LKLNYVDSGLCEVSKVGLGYFTLESIGLAHLDQDLFVGLGNWIK